MSCGPVEFQIDVFHLFKADNGRDDVFREVSVNAIVWPALPRADGVAKKDRYLGREPLRRSVVATLNVVYWILVRVSAQTTTVTA